MSKQKSKSKTQLEDQLAALHELDCNTHNFWSEEGAKKLLAPFGIDPNKVLATYKANPHEPKGLTLANGAKQARGASTPAISGAIVSHFGLRSPGMLGRGFQVRADTETVRKHLTSAKQDA